jgi:two-component system LytT family sensor kinase
MSRSLSGSSLQIGYPRVLTLALVWSVVGALAYGRHYLFDRSPGTVGMVFQVVIWMTCFYPWIAFSPLVFQLEQKYPLAGANWPRNIAILAFAGLPLSYIGAEAALGLNLIVELIFRVSSTVPSRWWKPPFAELFIHFMLYTTVVVAAYVIRNLIQLRNREREAAQLALEKSNLENSLHQAELETLRTRLNPHFLFNCLQNISVLTQEDPRTASQMLTRLGELLRTALRRNSASETTLEEEISLTKSYIAIEKIRFSDRLTVLFNVAPESAQALVPTFLLQPLVENAIVHGLKGIRETGIVSVRSTIVSNELVLAVTDNGSGLRVGDMSAIDVGVGLGSTCERLAKMYPGRHFFSIRSLPEGGTEVMIHLPLQFANVQSGVITHEQTSLVNRR